MKSPRVSVVARKHTPRHRGGVEEYQLTLTFRWPNGHTMSFVANDTVSAALMHRTIMPALQEAFPVDFRGVPAVENRAPSSRPGVARPRTGIGGRRRRRDA